jgi:hypothetical protein
MKPGRCAKAVAEHPEAVGVVVIAGVDLGVGAVAVEVAGAAAVAEAVVEAVEAAITNVKSVSGFWLLVSG